MKLKEYKEKKMTDPAFVRAYDELQPEMAVIRKTADVGLSRNVTQEEPAGKTGTAQN
ncbi:MAG: hypothetical protein J5822_03815 [Eubacteriaceae bacterium]|nr:hypothetical protein [Eubacteriaceae bacterium]